MASIEVHKEHIEEHLYAIESAIAVGVEKRPATIGLHVSACSIGLIELYLHVLGKISAGAMIKHEWFKAPHPGQKIAPLAERKISADFPAKEEILKWMYVIEEQRNKLVYGKPSASAVEETLNAFKKLHTLIQEQLHQRGETIA